MWAGLKAYDLVAFVHRGRANGKHVAWSYALSKEQAKARVPLLNTKGLYGALVYHDGRFPRQAVEG